MIVYEFPLNEHVRTLLKLERLFQQVLHLARQQDALSHQTALFGLFDLIDLAARNEMRAELQMELARMRPRNETGGQPGTNGATTEIQPCQIDQSLTALQMLPARFDQPLRENDWLNGVRQRANIPGGVNGFDLPHFHHWQHTAAAARQADLVGWITPMLPVRQAIALVLQRLRENGSPQALSARQGSYQQMLNGRDISLLRIGLPADSPLIPEASANRHTINIRFSPAGKSLCDRCEEEVEFQLRLCLP